jgi:hypothetical protein
MYRDYLGNPFPTGVIHPAQVRRYVRSAGSRGNDCLSGIVDGSKERGDASSGQGCAGRGAGSGGDELDDNLSAKITQLLATFDQGGGVLTPSLKEHFLGPSLDCPAIDVAKISNSHGGALQDRWIRGDAMKQAGR